MSRDLADAVTIERLEDEVSGLEAKLRAVEAERDRLLMCLSYVRALLPGNCAKSRVIDECLAAIAPAEEKKP